MTTEKLIELAKEAGFGNNITQLWAYEFQRFAALIENHALERAAEVCDSYLKDGGKGYATAIRALKTGE